MLVEPAASDRQVGHHRRRHSVRGHGDLGDRFEQETLVFSAASLAGPVIRRSQRPCPRSPRCGSCPRPGHPDVSDQVAITPRAIRFGCLLHRGDVLTGYGAADDLCRRTPKPAPCGRVSLRCQYAAILPVTAGLLHVAAIAWRVSAKGLPQRDPRKRRGVDGNPVDVRESRSRPRRGGPHPTPQHLLARSRTPATNWGSLHEQTPRALTSLSSSDFVRASIAVGRLWHCQGCRRRQLFTRTACPRSRPGPVYSADVPGPCTPGHQLLGPPWTGRTGADPFVDVVVLMAAVGCRSA